MALCVITIMMVITHLRVEAHLLRAPRCFQGLVDHDRNLISLPIDEVVGHQELQSLCARLGVLCLQALRLDPGVGEVVIW